MQPLSGWALVTLVGSHVASLITIQAAHLGPGLQPPSLRAGGPSAGRRTEGEGLAGVAVTLMKPSGRCNEDLMYRQGHLDDPGTNT